MPVGREDHAAQPGVRDGDVDLISFCPREYGPPRWSREPDIACVRAWDRLI